MVAPTPVAAVLADGRNTSLIKVYIPAGGDADVAATLIGDVSGLVSPNSYINILRVWWSLSGFSASIWFDATTDDYAITMAPGTGMLDFSQLVNGLPNPLSSGYTGDLMMTTNGVAAADDPNIDNVGFFIIEVLKK